MEYVAIDFETASVLRDSACSIGLVRFSEDGEEKDSFYSLIRPPVLRFDPVCTSVHHLDPYEIASSPTFRDIWGDVSAFILDRPLVAHNAQFDMGVLSHTLSSWGLECPEYSYYCTLSLSRKLWKGKASYRLTALASELGWEYDAHNALADALVCGRLFSRLCGEVLFSQELTQSFFSRIYKRGEKHRYPEKLRAVESQLSSLS